MKKIIVLMLVLAVITAGCQQAAEKPFEKTEPAEKEVQVIKNQINFKISNETKEKVEILQKEDGELEIEHIEPTMEALATSQGLDAWCKAGEHWNFKTEQEGIDAAAQWEIQGIIDSGEYAGLCHVIYSAQTPLGETAMDYYFAEDGESGYFEMKLPDGKTVKQEWHG